MNTQANERRKARRRRRSTVDEKPVIREWLPEPIWIDRPRRSISAGAPTLGKRR